MAAPLAAQLNREQRDDLRRRAWRLRLLGQTQQEIAQAVGVDRSTVSRWLARCNDELQAATVEAAADQRRQIDAQLDALYAEANSAWLESRRPGVVERERQERVQLPETHKAGDPCPRCAGEDGVPQLVAAEAHNLTTGEARRTLVCRVCTERWRDVVGAPEPLVVVERMRETRGQTGDARLLATAVEILAARRKLWGLDAPSKLDLSGRVELGDDEPDLSALTAEELELYERLLAKCAGEPAPDP